MTYQTYIITTISEVRNRMVYDVIGLFSIYATFKVVSFEMYLLFKKKYYLKCDIKRCNLRGCRSPSRRLLFVIAPTFFGRSHHVRWKSSFSTISFRFSQLYLRKIRFNTDKDFAFVLNCQLRYVLEEQVCLYFSF